MAESSGPPSHLEPSTLGDKSFWDDAYSKELENYASNPEDVGTIWFDDSDAESKILDHLMEVLNVPLDSDILDVGTGNGHLLVILRTEGGFVGGRLVGVDYSEQSVQLAKQIMERESHADIKIEQWDIMELQVGTWASGGFDILLDKGTFDAISLSDKQEGGRRIFEFYAQKICRLVKKGGYVLITSCNWTEPELIKWFEGTQTGLQYHSKIKYPSFKFGGQQGQTISSVCFRRDAP